MGIYQSEGSDRIIQVLGGDDSTGLGHDRKHVSDVVARLGAGVSKVSIDYAIHFYALLNIQIDQYDVFHNIQYAHILIFKFGVLRWVRNEI